MINRNRVMTVLFSGLMCFCALVFVRYLSGQPVPQAQVIGLFKKAITEKKAVLIDVLVADNDSREFTVFPVSNHNNQLIRCIGYAQGVYVNDPPLYDIHIVGESTPDMNPFLPDVFERNGYMRLAFDRIMNIEKVFETPLSERVMLLRSEVEKISGELVRNAKNGIPLILKFKEGKELRGMIDSTDPAHIQTMLYLGQGRKVPEEPYTEFISRTNPDVPSPILLEKGKEPFQKEIRRYGKQAPSIRPGLFTNTYTWMGKSDIGLRGSIGFMTEQLDQLQYASLFSLRVLDLKGEVHDLSLRDVAGIVSVERIQDEKIVQNSHQYYGHFEGITSTLQYVWNEEPTQTVFVDFLDRPFFAGKMVEYIPPYHNSTICHLVLANEQGDFVIIRSLFFLKSLKIEKGLNLIEKEETEQKLAALNRSLYPEQPLVIDQNTEMPVTLKSGEQFTRNTTLKVVSLKQISPENKDVYANHPLYDSNESDTFVEINFTLTNPNLQGNRLSVYFDEFSLYTAGSSYPLHCFFDAQRNITDVIAIDYAERVFTVVFKVPETPDSAYLRYSDMEPVKIIFQD